MKKHGSGFEFSSAPSVFLLSFFSFCFVCLFVLLLLFFKYIPFRAKIVHLRMNDLNQSMFSYNIHPFFTAIYSTKLKSSHMQSQTAFYLLEVIFSTQVSLLHIPCYTNYVVNFSFRERASANFVLWFLVPENNDLPRVTTPWK